MTRATHPASSFAWMVRASKDSSTVTGAHLRWLGSHARGDPQKATSTPREDSTRVFQKPASFLCAYVYLEGGARQVRGGQAVLDEARPRRQYRQAAGAACASDQGPPHFRRASSIDSSRSGGRLKGLICPINAIWSRRRIRPFKRART